MQAHHIDRIRNNERINQNRIKHIKLTISSVTERYSKGFSGTWVPYKSSKPLAQNTGLCIILRVLKYKGIYCKIRKIMRNGKPVTALTFTGRIK